MFRFPFTNFHELNLDWILSVVKQAKEVFDNGAADIQHAVDTSEEALQVAEQAASGQIGDGAVTTAKLADLSVTAEKLAQGVLHRPNLLKNWYFVGGGSQLGGERFPINQREQTVYTSGDAIDLWKTAGGSVNVMSSFVRLIGDASAAVIGLYQKVHLQSGVYTLTLDGAGRIGDCWASIVNIVTQTEQTRAITSGFCVLTFNINTEGDYNIGVKLDAGSQLDIRAIKLEMGETQTLKHVYNGAYVFTEQPDFLHELGECEEYFVRFHPPAWGYYGYIIASGATAGTAIIVTPQPMVGEITVYINGNILAKNAITNTTASGRIGQNALSFVVNSTEMELFNFYPLRNGGDGGYIDVVSNLL